MLLFYKIILLVIAFVLNKYYFLETNYVGCVICSCIIIYLIKNIVHEFKNWIDGQYLYPKGSINHDWDNDYYNHESTAWDNTSLYGHPSNNIEAIEKKIRLAKNFISFCDEKVVKNKPIIATHQASSKSTITFIPSNNDTNTINTFTIKNEDTVDSVKELVYKTILKVLNKQTFKPNEKYALLQSFYYIDINPTIINIYIDQKILQKGGLSNFNLCKTTIKQELCSALCFPKLEVKFIDMQNTTLLNYFLNNQQNEH